MRAQSRGEWPGVSRTLRLGFDGFDEWVGGGARPPPRSEDDGAGPRLGVGPRARWAELAAGNCARDGTRPEGGRRPGGGGGIMDPAKAGTPGAAGVGRALATGEKSLVREKLGTEMDG